MHVYHFDHNRITAVKMCWRPAQEVPSASLCIVWWLDQKR